MRRPVATAIILGALTLGGLAAAPAAALALVVPMDHSTRLNIRGSAASVLVGNPAIADVTVVDSHTLYLQGRGYGVTGLIVLDRAGRTLYSGDIRVEAAGSNVSIYRGSSRDDFACTPRCEPSSAPASPQAKFASAFADLMNANKAAPTSSTPAPTSTAATPPTSTP